MDLWSILIVGNEGTMTASRAQCQV